MINLTCSISTCPNDIFVFYGLIANKIETENIVFHFQFLDIEQLNNLAINCQSDICKISYAIYNKISNNYNILNSGSAIGVGNGPLLIAKDIEKFNNNINSKICLPGINTTANNLFSIFYPEYKNKYFLLFSDIESNILNNSFDAGVIIHENRFTYEKRGLKQIADLGILWQKETNLPIPLGGIVVKNIFDNRIFEQIDKLILQSIEYSYQNYEQAINFCKIYAQELDENLIKKHIELYVNEFTKNIGKIGLESIIQLSKYINTIS